MRAIAVAMYGPDGATPQKIKQLYRMKAAGLLPIVTVRGTVAADRERLAAAVDALTDPAAPRPAPLPDPVPAEAAVPAAEAPPRRGPGRPRGKSRVAAAPPHPPTPAATNKRRGPIPRGQGLRRV